MTKPIVFISHLGAERVIALKLTELVEQSFLGMIEVFVSSDPDSISMGSRWLDNITFALKNCAVELVLASPESIERPWVNFESGAGWVRDIPVIPICHSGMEPDNLPSPLDQLQGALATDTSGMQNVFRVLAKAIDCDRPEVEFDEFVATVETFEKE